MGVFVNYYNKDDGLLSMYEPESGRFPKIYSQDHKYRNSTYEWGNLARYS
jgi:hypothetical protein